MKSWYLLYCKRGQILRAKEHLERQTVNCKLLDTNSGYRKDSSRETY